MYGYKNTAALVLAVTELIIFSYCY